MGACLSKSPSPGVPVFRAYVPFLRHWPSGARVRVRVKANDITVHFDWMGKYGKHCSTPAADLNAAI